MSKTRLIVAAGLAFFDYGVIASMLGAILPGISAQFKLTPEQNGVLALAQGLGLIVASLAAGPLIDTKGKKAGLVFGLGLAALSMLAMPSAGGYGMHVVLWFLVGVGGGTMVTAVNSLASDIGGERRGVLLNLLNMFFGLGGLVTLFLASNLLAGDVARLAYTGGVFTALVFVIHVATRMPPPSGERAFKLSESGTLAGSGLLWLLSLMLFLYVTCEVGMWNWLARHLIAQGVPESTAFLMVSLGFALGLLLGRLATSWVVSRVSAPVISLVGSVLMVATTFGMLNSTGAMAWVAVFCAGFAMGPFYPTTLAMVGDAFPKATGTAIGIVVTCGWIGLAVSSRVIGAIAGSDPRQLKSALLVLPASSVAMILVSLVVRPLFARAKANARQPL